MFDSFRNWCKGKQTTIYKTNAPQGLVSDITSAAALSAQGTTENAATAAGNNIAIAYNNQAILTTEQMQQIDAHLEKYQAAIEADRKLNFKNIFKKDYDKLTDDQKQKLTKVANTFGIRFEKDADLPRTVDLVRSNGKQRKMVHTNQKLASDAYDAHNNTDFDLNRSAFLGTGTYAKVKLCFDCTDSANPKPMARVQMDFDNPKELLDYIKQVELSNKYNSEFIEQRFYGSLYEHKGGKSALYVYAEPALCDLNHLYDNFTAAERKQFDSELKQGLIPAIYQKLLLNVLQGLQVMHHAGDIHRDIKGANVLIYRNAAGELSAKISDLGLATDEKEDVPLATPQYASPQVFKSYRDLTSQDPLYDQKIGFHGSFFGKKFVNHAFYGRNKYEEITTPSAEIFANSKDDMFALGMMLFEHLTKEAPYRHVSEESKLTNDIEKLCSSNPFVAILLEIQQDTRADADLATHYLKTMYLLDQQAKKDPKVNMEELQKNIREILDFTSFVAAQDPEKNKNHIQLSAKLLAQYLKQNNKPQDNLATEVKNTLDSLQKFKPTRAKR